MNCFKIKSFLKSNFFFCCELLNNGLPRKSHDSLAMTARWKARRRVIARSDYHFGDEAIHQLIFYRPLIYLRAQHRMRRLAGSITLRMTWSQKVICQSDFCHPPIFLRAQHRLGFWRFRTFTFRFYFTIVKQRFIKFFTGTCLALAKLGRRTCQNPQKKSFL